MTKIKKSLLVCFLSLIHTSLFSQLVPYRVGDQWGYADANGKMVVPVQFDEAYPFLTQLEMLNPNYNAEYSRTTWPDLKSPVAVVKKNGLYGCLGQMGKCYQPRVRQHFSNLNPRARGLFGSDTTTAAKIRTVLKF